mgnify:CR=1 FL=1
MQPEKLGRGPEVPQGWLAFRGEQRKARNLVARPFADMCAGDVADVVHVEHEHCPETCVRDGVACALQAVLVKAAEIDPFLPVDMHPSRRGQ